MNSSKSNSQIDYMLSYICSVIDHNTESVCLYNKEKNNYRKELFLFQNLSAYFENRPFPTLLNTKKLFEVVCCFYKMKQSHWLPLPTLLNTKKIIWRILFFLQKEAISLAAMCSKQFFIVIGPEKSHHYHAWIELWSTVKT